MKTVSVKLPNDLDATLTAVARHRRTSKSAVVQAALEELVARRGQSRVGSALDRVRDLAGCVVGPADLSVNKAYLEGLGR
jgi:Arc/MetJ-type ribon-helix-helix transcriptional regulator